ncbi:hypothetical protein HRbin18_00665 [bacterium HR18]|nr:hypothetical protein HRbin18_00665 [bacterium HR18]
MHKVSLNPLQQNVVYKQISIEQGFMELTRTPSPQPPEPKPEAKPLAGAGDWWNYCPNCGHRLETHRCKYHCPRCHYFLSCSEFD